MNLQKIISQHLYHRTWLSYLLYPVSLLYRVGLTIDQYKKSRVAPYESPVSIISIGNIVSGGSGKTPFTIALAQWLQSKGYRIAISHRGYKGAFEKENRIISTRETLLPEAEIAGDEAWLIAYRLPGVPVAVGRNRKYSIELLSRQYPDLDYILLDDAFQHRQVKRSYDFVVFNSKGGIGNGFLLPAGILREPIQSLKRASYLVCNGAGALPHALEHMKLPIISGRSTIQSLYTATKETVEIASLQGERSVLLSGIGNPSSFEDSMRKAGIAFQEHFIFADHFDYQQHLSQLGPIQEYVAKHRIKWVITTEKDYAKLRHLRNLSLPLLMVAITYHPEQDFEIYFDKHFPLK